MKQNCKMWIINWQGRWRIHLYYLFLCGIEKREGNSWDGEERPLHLFTHFNETLAASEIRKKRRLLTK